MNKKALQIAVDLITLLCGFMVILPLVYAFFGAMKTPAEFAAQPPTFFPASWLNFENFAAVFQKIPVFRFFFNSLVVATITSVVKLIVALMAAYAFYYFRFPGRNILFIVVLATMMLPADTLIVTNYQTVSSIGLLDTYLGMCITGLIGASQMFMIRQSLKSLPSALRDAAMIDGCGDLRYILYVLVPINRPVLVTLFVQSFVATWNTYLWPLLVTNKNDMRTIQIGVTMLTSVQGTNYEVILAGAIVSLIPALFVFLFLRRFISKAMSGGALVG